MRLLSLRLKHFKGVRTMEVEFRPTGITLIQGPNEIGKTSLMSAFDLLMEYPDSSRDRRVEATQPVGQDKGTEIEACFQIGSETFRYFKRFHRDRETRLTVEGGPQPRTVAGREAHDAVQSLVNAQMDWELWKALKIVQGTAADQMAVVSLDHSTSLREALDRAAGGSDGSGDDTLFHRVEDEWKRYYTATGNERRPVFDGPRQVVISLQHQVDQLTDRVAQAESDARRVEYLQRQIHDLTAELGEATRALTALEHVVAAIQELETQEREALGLQTQGQDRLFELERQWAERERLTQEESRLTEAIAKQEQRIRELEQEVAGTEEALAIAKAEYETAVAASDEARKTWERLQEDAAIFLVDNERSMLDKQLTRIRQLSRDLATFAEARDRIRIAEDELKAIRKQERKVHAAASALQVGSPTVSVRALRDLTVTVNSHGMLLAADQEQTLAVAEPIILGVPGVMDITVRPGSSVSELQAKLDQETSTLRRELERVGAASSGEAEDHWNQWTTLTAQMERAQHQLDTELAGTERSLLEQQHDALRGRLDEYRARREDPYSFPATATDAQELAESAREMMNTADKLVRERFPLLEAAKTRAAAAKKERTALAAELLGFEGRLVSIRESLDRLRQATADEDLKANVQATRETVESLKGTVQSLSLQLIAHQAGPTRLRENQKRSELEGLTTQIRGYQNEHAELQGRLSSLGGLGLDEQLAEAKSALEKAQQDLAGLERRAHAAHKLREVMTACRDTEQRRYREPLRRQIVQLGQIVFGQSFDVALNESLKVESRTLHGITLSVDALSTGAKEQLALLVRLAAASLVNPNEGVPIILDDTLGHTDDDRLDLMAAVLNFVAKRCQIILITSSAKRYTKIGQAHAVDLWSVSAREQEVQVHE